MIPSVFSNTNPSTNWLDSMFSNDYMANEQYGNTLPDVNIIEHDDKLEMQMAVPGMNKNDININLEDDLLTISSEKEVSDEEKKRNYMKKEFAYNSFKRAFNIPENLDQDKIEAKQDNGILYITLPKKESAVEKGPKSIEVK